MKDIQGKHTTQNKAMIAPTTVSSTMKAAVAEGFGDIDENISIREDWPIPESQDVPEGYLVIRVLACALAPGDPRVLSGATDFVQLPKQGHPYVIGEQILKKCQDRVEGYLTRDYF